MSFDSHNDSCTELRNVLHRSLASLGCPHVPSLPTSTFLMTTNTNLKVLLWLLTELDSELTQKLQTLRSTNTIAILKDFFFETAMFPRSFIQRLDDIFNSSSLIDIHQLSNLLAFHIHKPIIGHNIQLALIEYLSELVVCQRNPPMIVHQDLWSNRDVLNMFEQLPLDETNLYIDSRMLDYADSDQQQTSGGGDDEQTSDDLKDVFGQVRSELLAQKTTDMNETEFETVFTNEQIQEIDKQLQNALLDTHQFFKRLETGLFVYFRVYLFNIFVHLGTPNLSLSTSDHQTNFILSNEIIPKLQSVNHLNEISDKVQSNDKIFTDKIHSLLTDLDKENVDNHTSLTLQGQVMLARNLAHTLNNTEQLKKT